jgi:predicted Zn-dependent protease
MVDQSEHLLYLRLPQAMFAELLTVLENLPFSADWVGLRAMCETRHVRSLRDQLLDRHGSRLTQGVMVEVMVQGQVGYGAMHSLLPHRILEAAQVAYRQAIAAAEWNLYPTDISSRPPMVGEYQSPVNQAFESLTSAEIVDILHRIGGALKVSDRIVQTIAELTFAEVETWFVSSNGSRIHQSFSRLMTNYQATAQAGSAVQTRSDNGWLARSYQGGLEFLLQDDLWDRVSRIGEQAVELLDAPECPATTTHLVLAPDQMLMQIHESVGHPLELDRILGDERNYAGGSFVKSEDFGQLTYGSPLMNITFDPDLHHEFASYGFDDTGVPASREHLIRSGKLLRGLGSLESQARLKVPGVASTRACSWNRPPIDRMANLNLEPGDQSFESLISGIERGVYMETNRSWSIDDQRHKFQFSCEYGRLIEDGKLTTTVKNPNYRGTTPEFWGNLVGVGDRNSWQMFGTPSCGKGEPSQLITVGHASPVAVFADIEVFGGDA